MIDLLDYLETALAGRYALQRELGRGAQATVYLARDIRHERLVALKVLRPELAALLGAERFLREIKLTARLQHPHILPLYDSGEADGALYYVMPRVSGESLRARLAREGQLGIDEAVRIARKVGEALDYAHRQGIVHRDIKPENVLLDEDGHALVADFGIARAIAHATDARTTGTGIALGTPAYMSPEQASGERELDGRSDVYSLGCVLYEMLSGRPPFTGPTVQATIAKRFAGPPASVRMLRPAVPPHIDAVIARALATAPADRFHTAREFSDALAPRTGSVAAAASDSPAAGRVARRPHLLPLVLVGLVGLLLLGGVLARVRSRSAATSAVAESTTVTTSAASSLLDPWRVTVATFENQTGSAALAPVGRMAADWITHGLVQTGLVDLVDARTAMHRAAGDSAVNGATGAPDLHSLVNATRAGTVISGSYYLQGDSIRFEARITDTRTGRLVATVESPSVPVAQPARGVDPLRQRVMGALATMLDPHFREWSRTAAIAPTFPAYREFADGVDAYQRGDLLAAAAHLTRASALDTSFHLAQLWALQAYDNFLQGFVHLDSADTATMRPVRDSLLAVLNASREELGPLDRALLDFLLAQHRGDRQAALRYGRQLAALWPDRYAFNVAIAALRENRPREAIDLLRRADPAHGFTRGWSRYWTTMNLAEHELGWHRQELVDAKRAQQLLLASDVDRGVFYELRALAALGRTGEAMALASATDTLPGGVLDSWWPMDVWIILTRELHAHGQHAAARQAAERGVGWAKHRPAREQKTYEHLLQRCNLLYAGERWDEARQVCTALLAKHPDEPDALATLASLAARRGDREAAERLAVRLGRAKLIDWDVGLIFAPSRAVAAAQLEQLTRAHIAALTGQREEAVRLLQAEADRWVLLDPLPDQLHWDPDFASLRGYPPFEALLRTKG